MTVAHPPVEALELGAQALDDDAGRRRAAAIYAEHGCLVVRGLMAPWVEPLRADIEATAAQALALLPEAVRVPEGWRTPDGTLFLPAPAGYHRNQQIMVLGLHYQTSAAFLRSAFEPRLIGLATQILGPDVELFTAGQCLYKEPVGGHPKHLHQDSAYFEHRFEGPVGVLSYAVDTDLVNGALHVVPGSHRQGQLEHVDTFSHLGLDPGEWPWERATPVVGRAGDSILFHVRCVHGSQENHSMAARPVFIHRYRRADDYVVVSATSAAKRQEAEARRQEARKENQRGLMVAGFRPHAGA